MTGKQWFMTEVSQVQLGKNSCSCLATEIKHEGILNPSCFQLQTLHSSKSCFHQH